MSRTNRKSVPKSYNYEENPKRNRKSRKERIYSDFNELSFDDEDEKDWKEVRDKEIDVIKAFTEVKARSHNQQVVLDSIINNDFTYIKGVPGTGKTHLAVGIAVKLLLNNTYKKIYLVRPALGVGRTMGYTKGSTDEKMAGFVRPLFDELMKFLSAKDIEKLQGEGKIEVVPFEFIRGRTLDDAVVILDEGQNGTWEELKCYVTRMGENSKFIIAFDPEQSDLPPEESGAAYEYSERFGELDGVAVCILLACDIQRHRLIGDMMRIGLDRLPLRKPGDMFEDERPIEPAKKRTRRSTAKVNSVDTVDSTAGTS